MKLGKSQIGVSKKPYIIAEMSGNHDQSIKRAKKIILSASQSGVNAIKFQTYKPDTITIKSTREDFVINDKESSWNGKNLYDLYSIGSTPWEWHKELIDYAYSLNLDCFSSVFDETAVDFLEDLNIKFYKISSFELNHLPLLKKVASTKKPIILSTGMASLNEINEAIDTLVESNNDNYALLKCTSNYPADPKDSNILTIPFLKNKFKCEVGLSDHTLGIGASLAAISHGATIIEKHLKLFEDDKGIDAHFSLTPEQMKNLVDEANLTWNSLGKIFVGSTNNEEKSKKFKRSIYVSKDIKKNDVITKDNIKIIRPGFGLAPKYYDQIIGKRFKDNIDMGTPLKLENIIDK